MATYCKVGKRWRAEVYKNGTRKSKTFQLKADAQVWAQAEESILQDIKDGNRSLFEAID